MALETFKFELGGELHAELPVYWQHCHVNPGINAFEAGSSFVEPLGMCTSIPIYIYKGRMENKMETTIVYVWCSLKSKKFWRQGSSPCQAQYSVRATSRVLLQQLAQGCYPGGPCL